jgi:5'-3' exonuclease
LKRSTVADAVAESEAENLKKLSNDSGSASSSPDAAQLTNGRVLVCAVKETFRKYTWAMGK